MTTAPILQALLLADRVYKDVTGKHIICGVFNKLQFQKGGALPKTIEVNGEERQVVPGGTQAGSPYVYLCMTDLRGKTEFVLRYVNLDQDNVLMEIRFAVECNDPLQTVELTLPMPALPHMAGVHALELLCGDQPMGSYRVLVEEKGETDGNRS